MEKNKVTYLDPKYDLTFKRVFAEHKNLCISLINSMLMFEGKNRVVDIEYQTNELVPELPILKDSIVDVRCKDKSGREFIVEMQMNWTESFKARVLLNATKAYVMQLDKAKSIELLKPVYSINLVNEIFEKSKEMEDEYYHPYKIVHSNHSKKQIKGLEFVFIELPKFKPTNRAERKLHELWLRFLTEINEDTKEVPKELLENEEIREAIEYMKEAAFSKDEKLTYDQNKIDVLTARGMLSSAKQEGKAEGLAEGKEKVIKIAKNLKNSGMPLEQISEMTDLTTEEIENL